ncbi:hypothetical protein BGZ60DRAFT_565649 [Tricladium varicosporioides]|nr:hypothetical protein BGZ60DRAFT_565649 [Hymenoscyphus varicosporioides]
MEPPRGRSGKRVGHGEDNDDQGQDHPEPKRQMNKHGTPTRRGGNSNIPIPNGEKPAAHHPAPQLSGVRASIVSSRKSALTPPGDIELIDLSKREPSAFRISHKLLLRPGGDFPLFRKEDGADVWIELRRGDFSNKYCYALHSYVLARASPWFSNALRYFVPEYDETAARNFQEKTGIAHWFEIDRKSNSLIKTPRQVRKALNQARRVPVIERRSQAHIFNVRSNRTQPDDDIQDDTANQEATSSGLLPKTTQPSQPKIDSTPFGHVAKADLSQPAASTIEVVEPNSAKAGEAAPEAKTEDEDVDPTQAMIKEDNNNKEMKLGTEPTEKDKQDSGSIINNEQNINLPSSELASTVAFSTEGATAANTLAVPEASTNATSKSPSCLRKTPIEKVTRLAMEVTEKKRAKISDDTNRELQVLETYNSIFLIFYNKPPKISTINIDIALQQSEGLVKLAEHLDCVSLVRPHLSNTLLSYGRTLYKAILQDPPRWLLLSTYLESAPIFREAIVHIVGMHPIWPWHETATRDYFKPDILQLIDKKALELKILKTDINSKLFCSSITVDGQEVRIWKNNKATFDTFFVVSLWRDWFVGGISKTKSSRDKALEQPINSSRNIIDAVPYRLMGQGGEAYLPLGETLTLLRDFKGKDFARWDPREVNEDLMIMKLFAMKEVKPLLASESMLDLEAEGIGYFTCTKIANEELPWVKYE